MDSVSAGARGVGDLISEYRDACPDRIALSRGEQSLNYRDLNERADAFASYLFNKGVVSGGVVPVCLERSFEWVIAALGVMRAGAAYVPLEPSWPDFRLSYALREMCIRDRSLALDLKILARTVPAVLRRSGAA